MRRTNVKTKKQERKINRGTKNNNGITLIALVVTIIILIILATVTLKVVLGEGSLIQRAQQAKDLTEQAKLEEQQGLNSLMSKMANLMEEDQNITATVPENWDMTKVTPVLSNDNKYVPVPKGFIDSSVDSERTVNGGFVIYEGTDKVTDENVEQAMKTRNQFVWVPVTNEEEFKKGDSRR